MPRLFSLRHLRAFLATESAGGIIMLAAATLALACANSPLSASYHSLISAPIGLGMDVSDCIKDVLMALFFFTIGLELKYEMREGALAAPGQKILPLVAALGGIALPAILYLIITQTHPEYRAGWAIPTATDIAFALCVLRLIGPNVPQPAKVFLLAIAIYDDLAAILIIAFFYAAAPAFAPLLLVGALCAALFALNRFHISRLWPYTILGVALWWAVHQAGIHPTIAGVITAVAIPLKRKNTAPLLAPLLHRLHPCVAFGVLPLFAFSAAGVDLRGVSLGDALNPLSLGVALALFLGKQMGIFLATMLSVCCGLSRLPVGVSWRLVYGVAILAGIGFTMSLFIGQLAFLSPTTQDFVKLGVLMGSLISASFGVIFLRISRTP